MIKKGDKMVFKQNTEIEIKLRTNWEIKGKVIKDNGNTVEVEVYENYHMYMVRHNYIIINEYILKTVGYSIYPFICNLSTLRQLREGRPLPYDP